jgi:hypothetical protein
MCAEMNKMGSAAVECLSGHTYADRPIAVHWGGKRHRVVEILARRRTPGTLHYSVRTDGELSFILHYRIAEDDWAVEPT